MNIKQKLKDKIYNIIRNSKDNEEIIEFKFTKQKKISIYRYIKKDYKDIASIPNKGGFKYTTRCYNSTYYKFKNNNKNFYASKAIFKYHNISISINKFVFKIINKGKIEEFEDLFVFERLKSL